MKEGLLWYRSHDLLAFLVCMCLFVHLYVCLLQPFSKVQDLLVNFGISRPWEPTSPAALEVLLSMKEWGQGLVACLFHDFSIFIWFPGRMALQVVQQMQSQQNVQMNMMMSLVGQVQGQVQSGSAGAAPDAGGTPKDDGSSDFQGVRYCQRCGKNAYLREGVCFNMECVPWKQCFWRLGGCLPWGRQSPGGKGFMFFFFFLLGQQISGPELQPSECPAVSSWESVSFVGLATMGSTMWTARKFGRPRRRTRGRRGKTGGLLWRTTTTKVALMVRTKMAKTQMPQQASWWWWIGWNSSHCCSCRQKPYAASPMGFQWCPLEQKTKGWSGGWWWWDHQDWWWGRSQEGEGRWQE